MREENFTPVCEAGDRFLNSWAWSLAISIGEACNATEMAGCNNGDNDVMVDIRPVDGDDHVSYKFKMYIGNVSFKSGKSIADYNQIIKTVLQVICLPGLEMINEKINWEMTLENDCDYAEGIVTFELYDRTSSEDGNDRALHAGVWTCDIEHLVNFGK